MLYRFLKRVVASVARFAENVVPAHAHVVPFSDRSVCDDVDYFRAEELSDRVVFLNGKWDFCYFSDGFAKNGFDSDKAEFVSVDVPDSWESMGFGQKRYLTEYGFLHSGNKVFDGKKSGNSSGVYKKIVPIYDLTKKYFLNFDKVNGAFEVYVNGAYCGFSALGYGEFDVTDKIVSGDNEILVAVKKYTAASFADGFKGFENTGIVGDVYFVVRNEQYLADVTFSSVMSAGSYKGKITLELSCVKADSFVTVTLEKDGKSVLEIKKEAEKSIECEFSGDFLPYLAEKPELYDLYVSISETGFVTECSRFKVGFGKLLYEDGVAVYNDRPIKLFGVDYNAVRASDGSRMSYDDYCADFALIKDFGFNAICPKAYLPYGVRRLAQSKGLYIIDSVPVAVAKELSSKGKHNFVAYATDYRDLVVDRTVKTYNDGKLDCNVVGMYFESGSAKAPNFAYAVSAIKDLDAEARVFIADAKTEEASLIARPSVDGFIDEINKVSAARPVYMASYAESYGVGNANLPEFAELVENTPCAMGGSAGNFIDDYEEGVEVNDGGMFGCDRKPYASAFCHRFVARPVKVKLVADDKIEVFNNSYFYDTSIYDLVISVVKNGKAVSKVKLDFTVEPRESRIFDVFVGHVDGDMYLNVECYRKGSETLISVEQITVHNDVVGIEALPGKELSVVEKFDVAEIRFDGGCVRFSEITGTIIGYNIRGKEILNPIAARKGGACFNTKINRPFVRNILNDKYSVAEYSAVSFAMEKNEESVTVKVTQEVKFRKKTVYTVNDTYTVYPNGEIDLHSRILPSKKCPATLDCFGKQLRFYPSFERVTYYGKGDGDNYIDLCAHSVMGIYDTTASDMSKACMFGQECGNRTDVHYVAVRDVEGDGILITADDNPFQIRVATVSDEEIVRGFKEKRLLEKSGVYLDVNAVVSGYGSGNGDKPLAKYTLMSGEQTMDVKVYPLGAKRTDYGL